MKHFLFILFISFCTKIFSQSTLNKSTTLEVSKKYYSPSREYFLVFQDDGNLVLYKSKGEKDIYKWATMTVNEKKGVRCVFQNDGNLVIYNNNNSAIWSTNTQNRNGERLVVQEDGNLVIYSANNTPLWNSQTNERVKIVGTGDSKGIDTKGYLSTAFCGGPNAWVRGNASFDNKSGILIINIGLETDDLVYGPKGTVTAILKDEDGKVLAEAKSKIIGTGGKLPGKAILREFSSIVFIDQTIAKKTSEIILVSECLGSETRIFNINQEDAQKMFDVVVSILQ